LRIIKERGLSQHAIAAEIPCSFPYLNWCLNGRRNISARIRTRLAEILGLPEGRLFHDLPAVDDSGKKRKARRKWEHVVALLVEEERQKQGLPRRITDESALEKLAKLVASRTTT
jgi:transcriptional regulator with XRE-family HTH domain